MTFKMEVDLQNNVFTKEVGTLYPTLITSKFIDKYINILTTVDYYTN